MRAMPIPRLPPILVSSAEVTLGRRESGPRDPALGLEKGRVIPAQVLKILSSREALLSLDGVRVLAKTFVPLKPGQQILLQVERSGGEQPVFRLIQDADPSGRLPAPLLGVLRSGGASGAFALLESLLSRQPHLGVSAAQEAAGQTRTLPRRTLRRMQALVTRLSLKSGEATPRFLNELIRGSGLLWERKLHLLLASPGEPPRGEVSDLVEKDIKGLALKLLQGGTETKSADVDTVKTFVKGLEHLQVFNGHGDGTPDRYLLPLPVWTGGEVKFGQMLLTFGEEHSKDGREQSSRVNVSFLLTLSQLGDLRADFSVLSRSVSGTFGVASEEMAAFVTGHLSDLSGRLEAHGYDVRHLGCRVLAVEALRDTALLEGLGDSEAQGVLNLVI